MKRYKKITRTPGEWVLDIVKVVFLAFVVVVTVYPFWNIFIISINDATDAIRGGLYFLPRKLSLSSYAEILGRSTFLASIKVSVGRTLIGTPIAVLVTAMLAYPLSRKDLVGRKFWNLLFVFTMYFGGGLVPTYLIVKQTGLLGSMWALFLPGVVAVGNVIIVRNFFENNIPRELLEAAEIDGASKWTVFVKMVIPLSRSIMAVMVVYSMVAYWNDWFTALIYLRADQAPLPLVLRNILIKSSTSASQSSMVAGGFAELNKLTEMIKFASIIVAAAPMLIVYPFVQKYFEKGFMAGAVKG